MINYRSLAIFVLVGFAATFESARNSLYELGSPVGGVGGVGGLTGQYAWFPSCNKTAAYAQLYCFNAGVFAGLTPFAIVTTLFWMSPIVLLALGGIAEHMQACGEDESLLPCNNTDTDGTITKPAKNSSVSPEQSARNLSVFKFVWALLSLIWFVSPLCAYMSSRFYQKNPTRVILAFALSSAFPLSWSAMFGQVLLVVDARIEGPKLGL